MANETLATTATAKEPVIIDLGKQKKKHIKRLRKGKGDLIGDVNDVMRELREAGVVDQSAQPVIIVVREKPEEMRWFK